MQPGWHSNRAWLWYVMLRPRLSPLRGIADTICCTDSFYCTTLSWQSVDETFLVERPKLVDSSINHGTECAPHTLFTYLDDKNCEEETLRIHAIFDQSVLEVFVNERTAITTRIYVNERICSGLKFFAESVSDAEDTNPAAELLRADVWDNLGA